MRRLANSEPSFLLALSAETKDLPVQIFEQLWDPLGAHWGFPSLSQCSSRFLCTATSYAILPVLSLELLLNPLAHQGVRVFTCCPAASCLAMSTCQYDAALACILKLPRPGILPLIANPNP